MSKDEAAHRNKQYSEAIENLHLSVVRSNAESVKDCLKAGVYVDEKLKGAWSPLMFACSLGHAEIVECLLQYGSNPNFHKGRFTPLMAACTSTKEEGRLLECVQLLLYGGADVDASDSRGCTALLHAAQRGRALLADRLLQEGASVAARDAEGRTALFWAINNGHIDVLKVLLKAGALKSFNGDEFLSSDLRKICTEKVWNSFSNDTNNNNHKLSSIQNGKLQTKKELPLFFETNESLLKSQNSSMNELIVSDVLGQLEELRRRLYQQYAAVYYARLRLDHLPRPLPRAAPARRLAAEARQALAAADSLYHNLRFLLGAAAQIEATAETEDNNAPQQWGPIFVSVGIVVVAVLKSKLFGLLST